ncbi:cytochrome b [Shewanella sp. C32]|uniref:Cytochrome b n=1 Tax=Shewanella electrica TaxID=515560 RepID=A0ABT2FFL2_9GAMM|nr:cytochrome b [Shewanella electrica]MCH1925171.1 cytochrome b [Shewanella electrica]MCS4554996.1 cytochrome b [Shewanella electrica]
MFRNTRQGYGLVAITAHWLSAVIVIGLFALGYWMVQLSYYSDWYHTAPYIHKSVGVLLFAATLLRLLWRFTNPKVADVEGQSRLVRLAAKLGHAALYLLLLLIMISGLLISTADGRGVEVFNWFVVPSAGELFAEQADRSGMVHQYAAYLLIGLVVVHALAALKHHFIDKDQTLIRMLKPNRG